MRMTACVKIAAMALSSSDAARVEVAVLLEQRERVDRPVLAPGLDHVEVGEQEQRLLAAPPFPRKRATRFIFFGDGPTTAMSASGIPAARKRFATASAAGVVLPVLVRGVDLEQLLVDLAHGLPVGLGTASAGPGRRKGGDEQECDEGSLHEARV